MNRKSRPREKMRKVVVETRERLYHVPDKDEPRGFRVVKGSEIVKEIGLCYDCYEEHMDPIKLA